MFEDCDWTIEDICANNHHDRQLTMLGIALLMPGLCVKERSHEGNLRLLTAKRYEYLKALLFIYCPASSFLVLQIAKCQKYHEANLPKILFMQ